VSATTDPSAVVSRVELLVQMGRPERALEEAEAALAALPDDPQLLASTGWVLLRLQRSAEAVPLLEQLVAARPEADVALYLLSIAQQNTGDVAAARRTAARALELDPDDARYHLQLADVHLLGKVTREDRALARERVAAALELAPEHPDRLLTAAQLRSRLGDDAEARRLVERGLAVAPDHPDLLYAHASLSPDAGTSARGLSGVLALDPDHAEAGYLLHLRVWRELLRLVATPAVIMGVSALVVTFAMKDTTVGAVAFWGWILLAWAAVTALRTLPVLRRVPRGLVRRSLRATPTGRATGGLVVVAWLGVLVAVVLLLVVRDAVVVRWALVAIAVAVVAAGTVSAVGHRALLRQAFELGYLAPAQVGLARVGALRASLRGSVMRWGMLLVPTAVVIGAAGPGGLARPDARGVASLAVVAWVLPPLLAIWTARSLEARLRAEGATPVAPERARDVRGAVGGAFLGVSTAVLVVVGVLALVSVPVVPNAFDGDGRYAARVGAPGVSTSECTGWRWARLACLQREREERMDEMLEDLQNQDFPTLEVPDLEIPDIEVPELVVPTPPADVPSAPAVPTP
jgi:Tfp pilus assembly protein PilF